MPDSLRTRIAAVLAAHIDGQLMNYDTEREECGCCQQGNATYREHVADAVIREMPELRRITQVRQVCVSSLNLNRVPGQPLNHCAWLADTVLNVLNGEVDEGIGDN